VILFQLGVHEEERLAELLGTVFECLLKQVPCSLELLSSVSLDELGEVDVPDFESDREVEELDTSFVDLETLLPVLVLFQESRIVDNDLSVGDLELHDLVVDRFRGLDRSDRLFHVRVERPKLERLEQTGLRWERLDVSTKPSCTLYDTSTYIVVEVNLDITR
jgi:hypothetical protein